MPKEQKKRGRREEKKRKRLEQDEYHSDAQDVIPTRKKSKGGERDEMKINPDSYSMQEEHATTQAYDVPFFGLLDDDEQAYFKRADAMLELNQFENAEERDLFLASVYREADGKELKIANSQSCSRLMERLIMMSKPSQLKALFQKFNRHFLHLVQHRFASHCCESLFLHSAPIVTQELITPMEMDKEDRTDQVYVSMENLFLYVVNELEGNLGYLMTDHFASHTLRVLLVVLSGRPLMDTPTASLLQSKKKEKIDIAYQVSKKKDIYNVTRSVPGSFNEALDSMISGTVTGLDTTYLRALATHPIGNPVLQLLLELEFSRSGKQKAKDESSLFRKLLPDDPVVQGTTSASFVTSLLYDTVGSRLLETIVQHAPGKVFKAIYRSLFREKLASLAKNETAGFVMIKMLERLSREDLQHATEQICPHVGSLIERSRTSIIKTLIERCRVREIDTDLIGQEIERAYDGKNSNLLMNMLKLDSQDTENMAPERKKQLETQDVSKTHVSLLAQTMLEVPGPLREMMTTSILSLDAPTLVMIAKNRTATHVLQKALTCHSQTKVLLRKYIQSFQGHILDLALDPIASHVVDNLWDAAGDQLFLRERVAQELLENEVDIKESFSGRVVWRNWMMDLYKRRRVEWIQQAKSTTVENDPTRTKDQLSAQSAIELARKKFAVNKKTQRNGKFHGEAENQIPKDQP